MPSLAEIILAGITEGRGDTWTTSAGVVQARNGGRADVLPLVKRPKDAADGSLAFEALPVVPNIPIAFLRSKMNGIAVVFKVSKGDTGILLHTTYALDRGRARGGGEAQAPNDVRAHHPGNAIFLPALVADVDGDEYTDDSGITIEAPSITIGAGATNHPAFAEKVLAELNNIVTTLGTATSPSGAVTYGTPYVAPTSADDLGSSSVKIKD